MSEQAKEPAMDLTETAAELISLGYQAALAPEGGEVAGAKTKALAILLRVRDAADAAARAEESGLRRLLFQTHGCIGMYGDDGEMQCSSCRIDFKRDQVDRIEQQITERGVRMLRERAAPVQGQEAVKREEPTRRSRLDISDAEARALLTKDGREE